MSVLRTALLAIPALLSGFTAVAVTGCGGSASQPNGPSTAVGPAGGTVTAASGNVTVVFPAGALAQDTEITVASASSPPAHGGYVPGSAYEFGPEGVTFAQPVSVTIEYDEQQVPEGIDEASLRLARVVDGAWTPVVGSTANALQNTVTGSVTGFSTYGAVGATSAEDYGLIISADPEMVIPDGVSASVVTVTARLYVPGQDHGQLPAGGPVSGVTVDLYTNFGAFGGPSDSADEGVPHVVGVTDSSGSFRTYLRSEDHGRATINALSRDGVANLVDEVVDFDGQMAMVLTVTPTHIVVGTGIAQATAQVRYFTPEQDPGSGQPPGGPPVRGIMMDLTVTGGATLAGPGLQPNGTLRIVSGSDGTIQGTISCEEGDCTPGEDAEVSAYAYYGEWGSDSLDLRASDFEHIWWDAPLE